MIRFDASENMGLINQPLLMMAGSNADTFYMTEQAYVKAVRVKSCDLFLIKGAIHIQTYWKPEYVAQEVEKATEFFNANL